MPKYDRFYLFSGRLWPADSITNHYFCIDKKTKNKLFIITLKKHSMRKTMVLMMLFAVAEMFGQLNLVKDGGFESGKISNAKSSNANATDWQCFVRSGNSISIVARQVQEGKNALCIKSNSNNEKRFHTCIIQPIGVLESSKVKLTFQVLSNQDAKIRAYVSGSVLGEDTKIKMTSTNGKDVTIYQSTKFQTYTITLSEIVGSGKTPIDFAKPLDIRIALMGDYSAVPLELFIDNIIVTFAGK